MINFRCCGCGEQMSVPRCLAGGNDSCPACGRSVPVPTKLIPLTCPACGERFDADKSLAGEQARCPGCGSPAKVPKVEWTDQDAAGLREAQANHAKVMSTPQDPPDVLAAESALKTMGDLLRKKILAGEMGPDE